MYKIKELEDCAGLVHGISTMEDGNMSFLFGEEQEVIENKKGFLAKLNIDPEDVIDMGPIINNPDKVAYVDSKGDTLNKEIDSVRADALITDKKEYFLAVCFADCFGIIVYEPNKKVLALIHGGYVPVSSGIIKKTLNKLKKEFEIDFKKLVTCITPGAHKCCLKYSEIVKPEFKTNKAQKYVNKDGEYYNVDLLNWIKDDLKENGVGKIIEDKVCSTCYTDKQFFSKIKQDAEKQEPGRNILVVGMV